MFGVTGLNPLNMLLAATLGVYLMRTAGDGTLTSFVPRSLGWLYLVPIAMGAFLGMDNAAQIPSIFRDLDMIFFHDAPSYLRDMFGKPMTFVLYALLVAAAVQHSRAPERFLAPMVISVLVMAGLALVYTISSEVTLAQLSGTYYRHLLSPLGRTRTTWDASTPAPTRCCSSPGTAPRTWPSRARSWSRWCWWCWPCS